MEHVDNSSTRVSDFMDRLEVDSEDGTEFFDNWETVELLFLASAVLRSDRNWVSVSRAIKPFGEVARPADWYTPKNCALQYSKLLNEIENEDTKKKTLPRTERQTSEVLLVKSIAEKRYNEHVWLNQQTKAAGNLLRTFLEMNENGDFDENLDDLLNEIEEKEKIELENYNEYMFKREELIASKKLNKSRITKGKAVSKDSKKKTDLAEEASLSVEDVIKTIKKEIGADEGFTSPSKPPIKSEMDTHITLNALLDSKVTIPSSVAPTSPLLTSLLRSIASSAPSSHTQSTVISPLKEPDVSEGSDRVKSDLDLISKSREVSPRSSVPQSPRPTQASSPLLNSLLKNSPSSTTPIQMSPSKEISPKALSSPFFNPTSALATAAAQQLAVATSTLPHSHQFFQQPETTDNRKAILQSSPVTSACLSAPTLSKLLEMPPSTPGRLPPLPILDSPSTSAVLSPTSVPSTLISGNTLSLEESKTAAAESPPHMLPNKGGVEILPEASQSNLILSQADQKGAAAITEASKIASSIDLSKIKTEVDDTSQENIDIFQAVYESINQAFEVKEIQKESFEEDDNSPTNSNIEKQVLQSTDAGPKKRTNTEEDALEDMNEQLLTFPAEPEPNLPTKPSSEFVSSTPVAESISSKSCDASDEDKGATSRKFYKSRISNKKEDVPEKSTDSALMQSPKKPIQVKTEPESSPISTSSENTEAQLIKDVAESTADKQQEIKSSMSTDSKSPVLKKPRLHERLSTEKTNASEDEMPSVVRRSGRRGKKGRGRTSKSTPIKQYEPEDQYEFTESTEENSVGYQAANTLCYMPRLKEDSRSEDSKAKGQCAQDSEDLNSNTSSPTEKKIPTPSRSKQSRVQQVNVSVRKTLFTSDEERMSDSMTSDDASNHLLSEDKLKKWEETCEIKNELSKTATENVKRTSKASELTKRKSQQNKRTSGSKIPPPRKERKISTIDMEELSTGSRESEEVSVQDTFESKDVVPPLCVDMEVETNDSQPSSSNAADLDKQMDEVENSVTIDFSPPAATETKEEKQDWLHGASPKSSEAVSQSSEESEEYESDNWDNHSVSTNKSTSHSVGTQPRSKRKERETPQYKAWKKAISIVLREASCHKNANVFLQKVTNDVAPGYLSIVHRPMDLSLIKKNIDNGVIRTTEEFHRDMLLMFQNAIMYNSSDHDVYQMAVEMQRDVIQQISAFLKTQSNDKDEVREPVSSLRGARTAKSQKGLGKHGTTTNTTKGKEEADRE